MFFYITWEDSMRQVIVAALALLIAGFAATNEVAAGILMKDNVNVDGSVTATSFSGSGSGLTGIPGTALTGTSVTVDQLATSAVTADKLANDAVTPGKIAFYGQVAIVAKAGGDYTSPVEAISNLNSWCSPSGASNPCLIKIMPGVYDLANNMIQLYPYIDIEGSGESVTKLTGNGGSGLIRGAANSEIRNLTVESTGGYSDSIAIYLWSGASARITNVTARASGGSSENIAIFISGSITSPILTNVTVETVGNVGIYGYGVAIRDSATPRMQNVTAGLKASGNNTNVYGFQIFGSSPVLSNVHSNGCYGGFLVSTNSDVEIRNASVDNCSVGIENNNSSMRLNNVRTNCTDSLKTTAVSGTAKIVTISNSALKGGIDNPSLPTANLTINIDNSVIEFTILLRHSFETLNVGNSKIYSAVANSVGATVKCAYVITNAYDKLDSTCTLP
jgi:hypothetical protein